MSDDDNERVSEASDAGIVEEETHITEITIQPDGRLYVFGTSRQVLEVLDGLRPRDVSLSRLLQHVRARETSMAEHGAGSSETGPPRSRTATTAGAIDGGATSAT